MFTIENAQALFKGLSTLPPIDREAFHETRALKIADLKDYHRIHPDKTITPELTTHFDPAERKQFKMEKQQKARNPTQPPNTPSAPSAAHQRAPSAAPERAPSASAPSVTPDTIRECDLNAWTIGERAAQIAFNKGARIIDGSHYHRDANGILIPSDIITRYLSEYAPTIETKHGLKTITQRTDVQLWREARENYFAALRILSKHCTIIDTIQFNNRLYQAQNAAPFAPQSFADGDELTCTIQRRNIPAQPDTAAVSAFQLYQKAISDYIQNGAELFTKMLILTGLTLIGTRLNHKAIRRHICIYGAAKGTGKTSFVRMLGALGIAIKQYEKSTPKDNFMADGIQYADIIHFDDFYRPKDQTNIIQSLVNSQKITINPKGKAAYDMLKQATIITTQNERPYCYDASGLYNDKCIYWKFDAIPTALDNGKLKDTPARQLATAAKEITEHPEKFALEALKAVGFINEYNKVDTHFKRPDYHAQLIDDLLKIKSDECDDKPAAPIGTPEHIRQFFIDHKDNSNCNDTQGLLEQYVRYIITAYGYRAADILKNIRPNTYLRIAAELGKGDYIASRNFDLPPFIHISKQSASKCLNRLMQAPSLYAFDNPPELPAPEQPALFEETCQHQFN